MQEGSVLSELCQAGQDQVELVIDLSNVCRDENLAPVGPQPRWARVELILAAWNAWQPTFERPVVRMIADCSLRDAFGPEDRQQLDRAVAAGLVVETRYADPEILDLAERQDSLVLTRDQFVGHRSERPWIDDKEEKFVQWDAVAGRPRLRLAVLAKRPHFDVSRSEERDALKGQRIDEDKGRGTALLRNVYRCDNPGCLRLALALDQDDVPPHNAAGTPVCVSCKRPLTEVGPRSSTAIVRLAPVNESQVRRLAVTEAAPMDIGRVSSAPDLSQLLDAADLGRISRRHARLDFDGRRLTVTDLGSANGTSLARWDADRRRPVPEQRLVPEVSAVVGRRDTLRVAGVLVIQWSGRRYPFDLDTSLRSPTTRSVADLGPTILPTSRGR